MLKVLAIALLVLPGTLVAGSPRSSQVSDAPATATATSKQPEPSFTIQARRRTFNCNQDERLKKIEALAWAEAGAIAEIANGYAKGNEWQQTMDIWMGADSTEPQNLGKIQCRSVSQTSWWRRRRDPGAITSHRLSLPKLDEQPDSRADNSTSWPQKRIRHSPFQLGLARSRCGYLLW